MVLVITMAVFITSFAVCMAGFYYLRRDQRKVHERLEQFVRTEVNAQFNSEKTVQPSYSSYKKLFGWRAAIRQLSRYFESQRLARFLEQKLIQAGWPLKGSEFLVVCCMAALLLFFVLLFLSAKILLAVMGVVTGGLLPVLILKIKIAKRTKAFNEQLGDSLILIANSLRTGYSFMQALEMVAKEMTQPISVEFGRTLREMNLGVVTEEALQNLAKRVNSDDLELVITAVLIQRQIGGNLAEILDNIAGTIRERVKIKGEIKTMTAQGRISGLIIGIMPLGLGLMIYSINPEYIKILFTAPVGKIMLIGAACSECLGILLIRKIVNIEV